MYTSDINERIDEFSDSTISQSLPPFLSAPPGWRSEIIRSNARLPVNERVDFTQTHHPSNFLSHNTEYVGRANIENSFHHHGQSFLTEEQQSNIVNTVQNQQPPPLVLRKTLPNNLVTYKQNVSVRYLQPPPLPPPGPLIIREVRPPQPPPLPPIQIRQQPPPRPSPPPLVLRERPPALPPRIPTKVVDKILPPPPQAPRRVIIEKFGACPPKPSDVIIERWLPYKSAGERRVLVERAPPAVIPAQEPNLLVLYDSPQARIHKEFINKGVVRADPYEYLRRYGDEINSWRTNPYQSELLGEASRVVPPPPPPISDYGYRRASSPYISNTLETTRIISPIPRLSSYHYDSPSYYYNRSSSRYLDDIPSHYCNRSSSRYDNELPYHYCNRSYSRYNDDLPYHYCNRSSSRYDYDDYPRHYGSYRTMTDITPSWDGYCRSSSYAPSQTIRVHSENEFHNILSNLTNGRVPPTVGSY